jgi:Ca2+-transporting ATPase
MIKALSDKIMIILSIAAAASLGAGLYEDLRYYPPETNVQKIHWIEGFSIMIAVLVVVFVSSLNGN